MEVRYLGEYGYQNAVLGFSLSYNSTIERTRQILPKYAFGIPGEGKFLESIIIWVDVNAPRYWWQEADTYRISTKQSESTIHTICKKPFTSDMFEDRDVNEYHLRDLNEIREYYLWYSKEKPNKEMKKRYKLKLKNHLPESFLQRRIWCFSYKTLQNIYTQRKDHELPQWQFFLNTLLSNVEHPEFIVKEIPDV